MRPSAKAHLFQDFSDLTEQVLNLLISMSKHGETTAYMQPMTIAGEDSTQVADATP
jgi:hypothetical protein